MTATCRPTGLHARFDIEGERPGPPELLAERGLVHPKRPVKVLALGEIKSAITVSAHKFSAAARAKIKAAGGRCEELG